MTPEEFQQAQKQHLKKGRQMTHAILDTNNMLHIDYRTVGQVMAITDTGRVQNATASKPQTKAQFRPLVAPATLGDAVAIDMPVYISTSPSDHHLNPALIDAIKALIA
jgi:hypothetical protein